MTKEADLTAAKTSITRRFIACTQSTGRIGKSTVAEGLIGWLRYAGVAFVAVDADSQHQTLSHRYPSDVESFDATKTLDDFARMIQALPDFPVILVDFPAQATNFLLSAAEHFRIARILRAFRDPADFANFRRGRSNRQRIRLQNDSVLWRCSRLFAG